VVRWREGGQVGLTGEAAKRGIKAVELHRGDDLAQLVHDAVSAGADGLAAAGGDGTQACSSNDLNDAHIGPHGAGMSGPGPGAGSAVAQQGADRGHDQAAHRAQHGP
jgi:hypothetical protein